MLLEKGNSKVCDGYKNLVYCSISSLTFAKEEIEQ